MEQAFRVYAQLATGLKALYRIVLPWYILFIMYFFIKTWL